MTKAFSVSLKAGERVFVNGAVLRVDRKVTIEFLNEVSFLLEQHVMNVEQTATPFRQLYFIVQTLLIDPSNADAARIIFETTYDLLLAVVETEALRIGLKDVHRLVESKRYFDALKVIRSLFPIENDIIAHRKPQPQERCAEASTPDSSPKEIALCR